VKILVVHNSYTERGGEDEVVDSEIKLLKNHGHEVRTYRCWNRDIEKFSFFRKLSILRKEIIYSDKTYNAVRKLVAKEKPDIAHVHNTFILISPSVYYALSDANVPIVQTLHNYRWICPKAILYRNGKICEKCIGGNFCYSIIYKCWRNSHILTLALVRAIYKHSKLKTFQDKISAYVVLSEFSKDKFIESGLSSEKIFVKPNFADSDTIRRSDDFENFAIFIGRLVDYKGVQTLVKAFKRLGSYRLKIIGDGPLYSQLAKEVKKIGNIDLLGRLSYRGTQEYIKRAAFVVLPSECYENTPRVVIESLSCGVPVLVSDRAFIGGSVGKDGIGLEFKAGDADSIISKVESFVENKHLLSEMGKNALRVYKERYTPQKDYELIMKIYGKAIEINRKLRCESGST